MLGAGKVGRAQSMDGFREYPTEFDLPQADEVAQPYDVAAAIGTDERRLHVRAYNHWVSLLRGRDFPSIEDLEPDDVEDFASNSVLLDFTCGRGDPAIPYVGTAIRDECGLNDDMRTIADVPSRSLLSRLTDHYLQIIANRSPVGFEAEFENPGGEAICYRDRHSRPDGVGLQQASSMAVASAKLAGPGHRHSDCGRQAASVFNWPPPPASDRRTALMGRAAPVLPVRLKSPQK